MIVRDMPNGQLLCIHQTAHALTAEQFCRHWGNQDFAPPTPYAATMLAISQHDNGWYEWELQPKLRRDGYPMDFLRNPDHAGKLDLWRLGISRVTEQHPYAGVLVSRHTYYLYQDALNTLSYTEEGVQITLDFLAEQETLLERARARMGGDPIYGQALRREAVESNSRLLQFGDRASLQVSIPWSSNFTLANIPVDGRGQFTSIYMQFDETAITFDPWPYEVDHFEVHMHGLLLDQNHFTSEADYHAALAAAPYYRQTWKVGRG